MQRLVEQLADDGELFVGDAPRARVHYHLSVYQHFADAGDEPVPPGLEVEGRIVPIDPVDLTALQREESRLTLFLADGRTLEFAVSGSEGRIRSTGRGLYSR
jgi:hypothetical protein